MSRIAAHGIEATLPSGWDGAVFCRTPGPGESTYPIMHAGNFALPSDRGDYGAGAVESMGSAGVFVALVEHGPQSVSTPLFAQSGLALPLSARHFNPSGLQRVIRGQAGYQRFFNEAGRAFCVYVVIGSVGNARRLANLATGLLESVSIGGVPS